MKKLLVLLLCCLSVAIAGDAVNYRTLRFTLPVYEMKSKVTENELVSAIGAKSKNKQGYDVFHEIYYLIDPDTTFSDTSECIYNLMVKTEIPQWHGVTSDYGNDCIGCCKVGEAWFTIKDSVTANHLFVKTERKHTFVLKLKYEECACVIDDWFRYLEDDHIYDKCKDIEIADDGDRRLFIDPDPSPEYPGGYKAVMSLFEENIIRTSVSSVLRSLNSEATSEETDVLETVNSKRSIADLRSETTQWHYIHTIASAICELATGYYHQE